MTLETLNLERKEKITNDHVILTISTICMCEELRILHKLKYINKYIFTCNLSSQTPTG
jgi:hypothetical protein